MREPEQPGSYGSRITLHVPVGAGGENGYYNGKRSLESQGRARLESEELVEAEELIEAEEPLEAEDKARIIQDAMDELKGVDIRVLHVTEKTQLTDYMVVCSGTSNIHIRAITDRILEKMKDVGIKGVRREGYKEARWVLLDFGDVVAHVFDPEDRTFYALEKFWEREKPLVTA